MPNPQPLPACPAADPRLKVVETAMRRHQFRPDALIEVLHAAQGVFGFLAPDLLKFVARRLKLPPSRVYGVATFYHFFTLKPKGRHTCVVCTGTACYVKGADGLLAALRQGAGVGPGETTADGSLSVLTARCLGVCGIGPLVVLDGTVRGHETPAKLLADVKGVMTGGTG